MDISGENSEKKDDNSLMDDKMPSNNNFEDDECSISLPIPEVIEMLKNLAACNEKLYKWEQSRLKLETIPETDPNKKQLMEIIDFMEYKSSTREKAIYLYQQLGRKCRQYGNYIGAAKAFERAAGLLMDVTDQTDVNNASEETILSTIRCLESAIHNYDAIHKYKHAGTLHYRCSRILRLINASQEQVEQHHIKALEYFTKPDYELKQRKRIDGLKISCYSSCSTWARMTHTEHSKNITKNKMMTTTHHKTITTNHTIKFHPGEESEEELEDSEDDSNVSNNSNQKSPSNLNNSNDSIRVNATSNSKMSFEMHNEDNHSNSLGQLGSEEYLEKYFDGTTMNDADDNGLRFNESMPTTPTTPSSLASSIHESKSRQSCNSSPVASMSSNNRKNYHYHKEQIHHPYSNHNYHHHSDSSKHHHQERYRQSYPSFHNSKQKMYVPNNRDYHQKPIFRCIEDRIESAKKLVKKLHKLCPFYKVSTSGNDAGRVYCRICDRYLGAVSSTLKNHVNTQEHRQAFEDNQQQQSNGSTPQSIFGQPGISLPALTSNSIPLITYPGNAIIPSGTSNQSTTPNSTNGQPDLSAQPMSYINNSSQLSAPQQQTSQPTISRASNQTTTKNFISNYDNSNNNEIIKSSSLTMIQSPVTNAHLQWHNDNQEAESLNFQQYRSVLNNPNHSNIHQTNNSNLFNSSMINSMIQFGSSMKPMTMLSHHHQQQQQHYSSNGSTNSPVLAYH